MYNAGDFAGTETVMIPFNTFTSDDPSASVIVSDLANTDVHIHKDASLTQRSSAAGVAVDIDVDGITGCHWITIDLTDNTDAGFYSIGSQFVVRLEGITVDAATLNVFIGGFTIGKMQTAMTAALVAANLDHLALTATAGADMTTEVADNTILSRILSNGDTSAFVPSTDGLQLIRDKLTDIETDTDVIDDGTSGLVKIASDVAAILNDTDVIDDATSGLVKIASDVAAILNDTDVIDDATSGLVKIASDVAAVLTDTGTTIPGTITTAQNDLDTITGADGVTLATLQGLYAPNKVVPDAAGTAPTATEIVDEWETQSLADPTGFKVNVMELNGTAQTANDNGLDVNAILALLDDARTEPAQGAPPVNPDLATKIDWLYKFIRNKITTTATQISLYNDAGAVIDTKSTISDDGTTFSRSEFVTGP